MAESRKKFTAGGMQYDPADRDNSLSQPLEQKRQQYACKDKYTTLESLPTWQQQAPQLAPEATKEAAEDADEESAGLADRVSLFRGDITTLEIDAIVNAANSSLLGGGGVDGAIHRAAGRQLLAECAQLRGCRTGEAKATAGYRLPARYVLHTVGPMNGNADELRSCYRACLRLVKSLRLRSVAFPCVSTGVYGFPSDKAAKIALATVRDFLSNDEYGPEVQRVVFCVFLEADYQLYCHHLPEYFPV